VCLYYCISRHEFDIPVTHTDGSIGDHIDNPIRNRSIDSTGNNVKLGQMKMLAELKIQMLAELKIQMLTFPEMHVLPTWRILVLMTKRLIRQ